MKFTDNDKKWGPLVWSNNLHWRNRIGAKIQTLLDEDIDCKKCYLQIIVGGYLLVLFLPGWIKPLAIKHQAGWYADTIKRLGRDYYYTYIPKIYGFSFCWADETPHFAINYGVDDDYGWNEIESKRKYWFLPWKECTHIRHSYYTPDGTEFYTEYSKDTQMLRDMGYDGWKQREEIVGKCPTMKIEFHDYDGTLITGTARMEEMEWHRGTSWCKWLRFFTKNKVRRYLNFQFDQEVGPDKSSWKGGTIGSGIDMLPGESAIDAFKRWCAMPHRSKYKEYNTTFTSASYK
jgi:hypothetical protein